jgi:hypothetical protein
MQTELTTALAAQIQSAHNNAQQAAGSAQQRINEAIGHAAECGLLLMEAEGMTRGQFLAWMRDNVPSIAPDQIKRYVSVAKAHQSGVALNHRQLLLAGIVEAREIEWQARNGNDNKAGRWVRATSTIYSWWRDETKTRPVSQWSAEERDAARITLKPVVEIYQELCAGD